MPVHRPFRLLPFLVPVLLAGASDPLAGQGLKIAVGDVGLGIGDVPRIDGLRLNFRDRALERVRGVNVTIWTPYRDADGTIEGLALGLPMTGADHVRGIAIGAGVAAEDEIAGIGVGAIGVGAGGSLRGLMIGGVGAGTGGDATGILISGIGAGAGGDVRGISLSGIGSGSGGDFTGLGVGAIGVGAGGSAEGILIGGVGVGAGGGMKGLAVGGVGVGSGGDLTGVAIGGIGVGVGGELKGIGLGGIGVGAPEVTGFMAALAAGGADVRGVVIAPAYFRLAEHGSFEGLTVSAFNRIGGSQRGLAIGLLNIAEELHGVQVGLINIARNKDSFQFLPLVNYHP